jgi:hypothetical protein
LEGNIRRLQDAMNERRIPLRPHELMTVTRGPLAAVAALLLSGCVAGLLPAGAGDDLAWQLGHGTVSGALVGVERAGPGSHAFRISSVDRGCAARDIRGGEATYPVQPDGTFILTCATGPQVIEVIDTINTELMVVGEQEAVVLPAATINITIQLHEPRPLPLGG